MSRTVSTKPVGGGGGGGGGEGGREGRGRGEGGGRGCEMIVVGKERGRKRR